MSEKRFIVENDNNEVSIKDKMKDNYPFALAYEHIDDADNLIQECLSLVGLLNEQCELIEELHDSDHMGWGRAEKFEKELKQKKIYIKRLEYKVQKFKEENEQLRRLFEEMKQPITINLTEEDEKELRKLLGLIDDE